ncbi:MAG: serine/threonine protein kinase, partial [Acidobacteria bacterium]|nr:serine/threonine protein kinase [Acidobacteriota bacterium]
MDLSGKRLGHIRVERVLGVGGMGDVYRGFDEKLMRPVALKALHRDQQLDDEARARLIREARTLSQLEHPNICRIHDYMEGPEGDVLVLELIDGRTLDEVFREGISNAEKLRVARDIAEVLVAAHRAGVVHRDLKPENVMITTAGEVKVLDFGLARWVDRSSGSKLPVRPTPRLRLGEDTGNVHIFPIDRYNDSEERPLATAAGLTVGTPMFMSPEQARGEMLTPASDMYSFGLLLQ